jgi:hypothetical protein
MFFRVLIEPHFVPLQTELTPNLLPKSTGPTTFMVGCCGCLRISKWWMSDGYLADFIVHGSFGERRISRWSYFICIGCSATFVCSYFILHDFKIQASPHLNCCNPRSCPGGSADTSITLHAIRSENIHQSPESQSTPFH